MNDMIWKIGNFPTRDRQIAIPNKASIAVSSADELASDDSMNDFLNDDVGEDRSLNTLYFKSSRQSLQTSDVPFYELREVFIQIDVESDVGLPEFGALVRKNKITMSVALSKGPNEQSHNPLPPFKSTRAKTKENCSWKG